MIELWTSSEIWIEAGLTLLVGLIIAAAVAALVNFAARRLLDDPASAGKVAGGVFWVLTVVAVLIAIARLAEPDATQSGLAAAATRLLETLPDLLIGIIVVVLGWALAVAVRSLLREVLRRLSPIAADVLPSLAYWAILVLAALIAADQVGIQIGLLRNILLLVLAGLILAAALALGLGARGLIGEVVAGRHVERILGPGDDVEVDGIRGRVLTVGHASTRLIVDGGEVEIPNGRFLASPVHIHDTRRS